jgi:hypothetical protein
MHGYGMDGWNMGWMWMFGIVLRPRRRVDHAEKSVRMNSNEVYAYVFCP